MKQPTRISDFTHSPREPFYETAPPQALLSLERGLAQIARGEVVSLNELSERLAAAVRPPLRDKSSPKP